MFDKIGNHNLAKNFKTEQRINRFLTLINTGRMFPFASNQQKKS